MNFNQLKKVLAKIKYLCTDLIKAMKYICILNYRIIKLNKILKKKTNVYQVET